MFSVFILQKIYIMGPQNFEASGLAQPRRAMGRPCFWTCPLSSLACYSE